MPIEVDFFPIRDRFTKALFAQSGQLALARIQAGRPQQQDMEHLGRVATFFNFTIAGEEFMSPPFPARVMDNGIELREVQTILSFTERPLVETIDLLRELRDTTQQLHQGQEVDPEKFTTLRDALRKYEAYQLTLAYSY